MSNWTEAWTLGFLADSKLNWQALNWNSVRRKEVLETMLKEELAMVDDQDPGGKRLYWFPCLADFSGANAASASAA